MKSVNFYIDGNHTVKSETTSDFFVKKHGLTIHIFGEIIGAIIDNDVYNSEEIKKLFKFKFEDINFIKKIIRNSIGSFYVIISQLDNIQIICSYSSPGLFYKTKNKIIYFSNTEKYFFRQCGDIKEINEEVLLNTVVSHQILLRPPFATIFNDISRLPGATSLTIDKKLNINLDFQLLQEIPQNNYKEPPIKECVKRFEFLIENTLKLIVQFYNGKNLELFFSGGIDSSVLMLALKKTGMQFTCRHVAYNGSNSQNTIIAKKIADKLNIKIKISDESTRPKFKELIAHSISGFGTINVPQQFNIETSSKSFGYKDNLNIISGQNADTVYHVDTFAPNSATFFPLKILRTIESLPKRIMYSNIFLHNSKNKFFLKFWPFKLNNEKLNNNFVELLTSLSVPINEHVVPLSDKLNIPDTIINRILKKFKYKNVFLPVYENLKKDHLFHLNNLNGLQKNFLIKVFRWYRTINNVAVNYHNNQLTSKLNRIIPFTDGPLTNFFFRKSLSMSEMFFVKRIIYIYFKKEIGHSYSYFCKYKFSLLLPLIFIKILKIFNFYKFKNNNPEFSNELNILRKMRFSKNRLLTKLVSNNQIQKYLDNLYDILENHDKKLTKEKMMMLCRLVNLENMIYSIK